MLLSGMEFVLSLESWIPKFLERPYAQCNASRKANTPIAPVLWMRQDVLTDSRVTQSFSYDFLQS